jgi:signal transduction histidine kinase
VSQLRTLLGRYGADALVVALALASAIGTPLRTDPFRPDGVLLWLETLGIAAVTLALLLRRRWPFVAPAAIWLMAALLSFLDGRLIPSQPATLLAGMASALLLGNLRNSVQARAAVVVVLISAAIVVDNDPGHTAGDFLFTPVLFVAGWMVGFALRGRTEKTQAAEQRAAQAERERQTAARIAVAEERSRIARELHDVVAHAMSVMVLQVGAVRHRMSAAQAADREALQNVEEAGRAALAEMRRLLGAMRRDGEAAELQPQPGLRNLDALLSDVRAAGLDVHLQVHGEPVELPPALDLSAYRILQEGLTNALRHSRAERAEVDVTYGEHDLLVAVRDDGRGSAFSDGLGHGLVGIRERVKIYGGEMSAGSENGGGFALRARLPLRDGGP